MLKEPVILEVAKDTYLFNLMGMQSPALIVGAERAMLIDTGLGNVDMTEQVRRVTDKPIMLVLSHAHSDHMGGIGQFEDIYLHPADIPRAKAFAASHLVDEAKPPLPQQVFVANCKAQFDKNPDNLFVIPGAVLPDRYAVHRFHPLKPDQVIDLGGRQVQILEERGHTAGEIAVLDFQSRILFAGDGLSSRFSVTAADIHTVYGDLLHIRAHASAFDRIYHGHFGALEPARLCSDSIALLDAVLKILSDALDGTDPGQPAGSEDLRTRSYGGVQLYWRPAKSLSAQ